MSQEEAFEEKLREAMDLAGQKSAQGRTMALESMCTAFLKKFIPDFVEDRRMTLTDIVERSMKKGKSAEQMTGGNNPIFRDDIRILDWIISKMKIQIIILDIRI